MCECPCVGLCVEVRGQLLVYGFSGAVPTFDPASHWLDFTTLTWPQRAAGFWLPCSRIGVWAREYAHTHTHTRVCGQQQSLNSGSLSQKESLRKETCQVSLIFISVVAPSQSCFYCCASVLRVLTPLSCVLHKCFTNALTPSPSFCLKFSLHY